MQTTMQWQDMRSFEEASTGELAKEIFGDVKNFTEAEPVVLNGSPVDAA